MQPVTISIGLSKIYLIPCRNGYLQIDTGYDRDYTEYRQALRWARIDLKQIRYVLLTHHHDDHAGALNELVRDADVTILAHPLTPALLAEGKNDMKHGGGYLNRRIKFIADVKMRLDPKWTLSFPPFAWRERDVVIAEPLSRFPETIGVPGVIVHTPGHTVDHMVLVLKDGSVFCGDAASTMLLELGTRYATIFMTDMEAAYRSWQKILDAGGKMVYPTHGDPFPAERLQANLGKIRTEDLVKFF